MLVHLIFIVWGTSNKRKHNYICSTVMFPQDFLLYHVFLGSKCGCCFCKVSQATFSLCFIQPAQSCVPMTSPRFSHMGTPLITVLIFKALSNLSSRRRKHSAETVFFWCSRLGIMMDHAHLFGVGKCKSGSVIFLFASRHMPPNSVTNLPSISRDESAFAGGSGSKLRFLDLSSPTESDRKMT